MHHPFYDPKGLSENELQEKLYECMEKQTYAANQGMNALSDMTFPHYVQAIVGKFQLVIRGFPYACLIVSRAGFHHHRPFSADGSST